MGTVPVTHPAKVLNPAPIRTRVTLMQLIAKINSTAGTRGQDRRLHKGRFVLRDMDRVGRQGTFPEVLEGKDRTTESWK
jgi:hypothetical protein